MNLNRIQAIVEIPLDQDNDSAWMEVLMGQGQVMQPPETLSSATREVVLLVQCHIFASSADVAIITTATDRSYCGTSNFKNGGNCARSSGPSI